MNGGPRTKITRRRPWAASLLTTVFAFALLCLGILLLSQRFGTADASFVSNGSGSDHAIRDALEELRDAEVALSTADYGEARRHVSRARAQLEPLAGESEELPGDP